MTRAAMSHREAGRPSALSDRVIRLVPTSGWAPLRLDQVWAYRELLLFLAARDIRVRYKQTFFGVGWAVLQPLVTTLVFTVVFGRLADVPSDGAPYAAFALAGLVPWTYFATSLQATSLSLVANVNLVTKVWFPRLCLPVSTVLAGLVDLGVALVLLLVVVLALGIVPSVGLLAVPLLVLLAAVSCLGAGLWLAAANVRYRDVRQVMPFLVQVWLFATPVVYPSSLVEGLWRHVYALNPMVGVVEGFRWAFLGTGEDVLGIVLTSAASALVLLVGGAFVFRRLERGFADVI